ncbi:MAG: ribonuclease Z [Lachnospiraceae bacterium]|nr:ribonuclease Z [Lachnospiraceae bacterium]
MLDVCLLGCGGMMPLPYRWLTSLMMRINGTTVLIDCGEGTQIAVKEKGWSFKPIDVICFTHYHGDHISGLPGLLLTMGNSDRTEPVTMIGPKGLTRVVGALRVIAQDLPFEIRYVEIEGAQQTFEMGDFAIDAFRVKHNVLCYGYSLRVPRAGKFDTPRALEQGIPQRYWGILQKGETVTEDGHVWTPDMVLGPERRGLKVTYCTDSRPTDSIAANAEGADLFICEGMYGEPGKEKKAREFKHMTMYEAARLARDADVGEMWLTHYSPSLNHPEQFLDEVRKIFPRSYCGKDAKTAELDFPE